MDDLKGLAAHAARGTPHDNGPTMAPAHCTCIQCELFYRLRRLRTEKARALAEWVADGPEEHAAARATVREIIGL